jgi:protoporphyrinogen oxidase
MNQNNSDVAIIGAGPAGLALGLALSDAGIRSDIYDRASFSGGLSRSLNLWDINIDLGPHAFYSDSYPEALHLWERINGNDIEITVPDKQILFKQKLLNYPFTPGEFLKKAGLADTLKLAAGYFFRNRRNNHSSTDDFVRSKYGSGLLKLFVDPYCRKFFGLPATEVHETFAASFFAVRQNSGGAKSKKNRPQLITPAGGSGQTWSRVESVLRSFGSRFYFSTSINAVVPCGDMYNVETSNDESRSYKLVVSTLAPDQFLKLLGEQTLPTSILLKSRHTALVYIKLEGRLNYKSHYVTCYSDEVKFGRVMNDSGWRPHYWEKKPFSVLCVEYWYGDHDEIDRLSDDQLAQLALEELTHTGLNEGLPFIDAHVERLKKSIPVLHRDYKQHIAMAEQLLLKYIGVFSLGRHGTFSWDGQEDSILSAYTLARRLEAELKAF